MSTSKTKSRILIIVALAILLVPALVLINLSRSVPPRHVLDSYTPWNPEVVAKFESLPLQEDGRLKPLKTVARYKLMRMNNSKRLTYKIGDEKLKISATEWMLDCLFRPEVAADLPIFKVNNPDVLTNLGMTPHPTPRERYSYRELWTGANGDADPEAYPLNPRDSKVFERLSKITNEWGTILSDPDREEESKAIRRDTMKAGTLQLKSALNEFEWTINALNFARDGIAVDLGAIHPDFDKTGTGKTPMSQFLRDFDKVVDVARGADGEVFLEKLGNAFNKLQMDTAAAGVKDKQNMTALAMFPPIERSDEEWVKPGYLIERLSFRSEEMSPDERKKFSDWAMPKIKTLEELVAAVGVPTEFEPKLDELHTAIVDEAKAREEYKNVNRELAYIAGGYFHWAMGFYFLAFILIAFTWLSPSGTFAKYASWGTWAMVIFATFKLSTGIFMRSIVLGRPPISTLYETIPFITASVVILCMLIELIDRKRIALAVATVLGVGGMFLAMRFEIKEARDTLKVLEAVLRSNYWLATHVIFVNIGYAAVLLAGAIGHVYIFARLFKVNDRDFLRATTRMVYGMICFGLIFALVGTVYGGVWANDSWGRFWGWDPKENGALMICLGCLAMMHARMGGYIRDLGISMSAVFIAMITVFSWWHVNQLETGLHSYGFTSGIMFWIYLTYGIELAVIAIGVIVFIVDRAEKKGAKKPPPAPSESNSGQSPKAAAS